MKTKTVTVLDFVAKHEITMKAIYQGVGKMNPKDKHEMDKWKCELARPVNGKLGDKSDSSFQRMTVDFYTGFGHRKPGLGDSPKPKAPSIDSVLDCLALNASDLDCSPLFFDVQHQTKHLKTFLGNSAIYDELISAERL